jgi:hypothetical protein
MIIHLLYLYIIMEKHKHYKLKGGSIPPPEVAMELANWQLVRPIGKTIPLSDGMFNTETMRFYKNELTIIVVIRGTRNLSDLKQDFSIAKNKVDTIERYRTDKAKLLEVQSIYYHSPETFSYYGIAHSLGGALMDRFIKEGLLDAGISFNPAVEPKNYSDDSGRNQRIYNRNDAVYNWFGKNVKPDGFKEWYGEPKLGAEVEPIVLEDEATGPLKRLNAHRMASIDSGQFIRSVSPQASPRASPRATEVGMGKYTEPDIYIY